MSQQQLLKWTPRQCKIYSYLQQGMSNADIVKTLHVSKASVTIVKNAIAKGEHPADVTPGSPTLNTSPALETKQSQVSTPVGGVQTEAEKAQEKKEAAYVAGMIDAETEAKLVSSPVIIPITQIMQSWRAYLVQGRGWSPTTRWQDIIDTTFVHYARSLDPPIILQGWYEGERRNEAPAAASNGGNGNGGTPKISDDSDDGESEAFKQLTDMVAKQILKLAKEGKLGG